MKHEIRLVFKTDGRSMCGELFVGDQLFANVFKFSCWGNFTGQWCINRHRLAFALKFPEHKPFDSLDDLTIFVHSWFKKFEGTDIVNSEVTSVSDKLRLEQLSELCAALLCDLKVRIVDRADSSLPEWELKAKRLGVIT